MQIGEGFAGDGRERRARQHGARRRRTGRSDRRGRPRSRRRTLGHAPFVVVVRPNVPVKPFTLFVNKADGRRRQERAPRAAHVGRGASRRRRGRARGGAQGRRAGVDGRRRSLLIAAVWVNPEADDEDAVYANNEAATLAALTAGRDGCADRGRRARRGRAAEPVLQPVTITPEQAAHDLRDAVVSIPSRVHDDPDDLRARRRARIRRHRLLRRRTRRRARRCTGRRGDGRAWCSSSATPFGCHGTARRR